MMTIRQSLRDVAAAANRALDWWAQSLMANVDGDRRSLSAWRVLLMRAGTGFDVYTRRPKGLERAGWLDPANPEAAASWLPQLFAKGISREDIVVRLSPDEIVSARLTLPAAVRDVLNNVLTNQLERHGPWPADKAYFDYEVTGGGADGSRIQVQLWIAGKSALDDLCAKLTSIGLEPGRIDCGANAAEPLRVDLLRRIRAPYSPKAYRVKGLLKVAACVTLAVHSAGLVYMFARHRELDRVTRSLADAQKMPAISTTSEDLRQLNRLALERRRDSASLSILVEALARAVPDDAWLERLEVRDANLIMSGKARSAASLVAPLEASRHVSGVHFAAPTTREENDRLEAFTISARVEPLNELAP